MKINNIYPLSVSSHGMLLKYRENTVIIIEPCCVKMNVSQSWTELEIQRSTFVLHATRCLCDEFIFFIGDTAVFLARKCICLI